MSGHGALGTYWFRVYGGEAPYSFQIGCHILVVGDSWDRAGKPWNMVCRCVVNDFGDLVAVQ